ncbi:MAG: translation elongation factor Ts [Anaerovoracaceae bacterium]|jgi:elongation factor Ts
MAAVTAALIKELREKTGAGMMDCKKALMETDGDIDKAIDVLRENGKSKAVKKADRIAAMGLADIAFSDDASQAAIVEVNSETDFVAKNPDFQNFVHEVAVTALNGDAADMEGFMAEKFDDNNTVQEALTEKIATIGEKLSIRRFQKIAVPRTVNVGYKHNGGTIAVVITLKTDATAEEVNTVGRDVAMQVASMSPRYISEDDVDPEYIASETEILKQQALNEGKPADIVEKMIKGRLKKELKEVCLLDQKFVKDNDLSVAQYVQNAAKEIGKDIAVVGMVRYEVGEGIEKREENFAEEVAKQMQQK